MARIALISDIHGNLEALRAVLADIERHPVDRILCLGDVVGYGPDPCACIDLVFQVCEKIVMGNHDEAAVHPELHQEFNPVARKSLEVTRSMLDAKRMEMLKWLPDRARVEGVSISHAGFGANRFSYLYSAESAADSFANMGTLIGAVGHTHIPAMLTCPAGKLDRLEHISHVALDSNSNIPLPQDHMTILNPGSVGQPRDRNPEAAWGLLDVASMCFHVHRVGYDVESVVAKVKKAGMPEYHGDRLRAGT